MEKVKLLVVTILGVLVVFLISTSIVTNVSSLEQNVKISRYTLCSNIKEYNETIKQFLEIDNEYNNIDYYISSDINNKSIMLDECMEEGDIEKINNSFLSLVSSSNSLLTINYDDTNEFFSFVILRTKLSSLETKIFISQQIYNNAVRQYNEEIVSFPTAIISLLYGFNTVPYFEIN